jgi:hypothetical protein
LGAEPKGLGVPGAGAAPKGLGAAERLSASVPGAGVAPNGLGAAVPKPVGGFDSVVPEEPNEGFVPPTEGREEATPLPNPNDAVGADTGADVVADEEVVGREGTVDLGALSVFFESSKGSHEYHFAANALNSWRSLPLYLVSKSSACSARDGLKIFK